jgi:hypothetical protein
VRKSDSEKKHPSGSECRMVAGCLYFIDGLWFVLATSSLPRSLSMVVTSRFGGMVFAAALVAVALSLLQTAGMA